MPNESELAECSGSNPTVNSKSSDSNKDNGPDSSTGANATAGKKQLEITQKLRVLCLHGYRQNGDAFKNKMGAFRKCVSKYAEFVFITAPHTAKPLEDGGEPSSEQRSWWANKEDGSFKGTNKGGPAIGFEQSLRLVEEKWEALGPFQGLLGFSQGACFAALICGFAQRNLTTINPQFAVLAAGFMSQSLVHLNAYEEIITIPTLHIYGTSDEIIPGQLSDKLASFFDSPEFARHPGGHYIPATSEQKRAYVMFFQDRLQDYLERYEMQTSTNLLVTEGSSDESS